MPYRPTSTTSEAGLANEFLASHPTLLSRAELRRQFGDRVAVDDALARFVADGLVHCIESGEWDRTGVGPQDYFWGTRALMAAEEATTQRTAEDDDE